MASGIPIQDGLNGDWMLLPAPYPARTSGIYAIVNRDNGKIYVGSAVRMNSRWNEHRMELRRKEHHSRYLQRAFHKNPGAFYIEVIEDIPNANKEQLLGREQFWMDFYKSYNRESGYNSSPTARSCQGIKRSPEFLAKVSASLKGRKMSPERLKQHTLAVKGHKGRGWTESQRSDQRNRALGKKQKPETIRKRAAALKARGHCQKPVTQFSKEGEIIACFDSITEAENYLNVERSNISYACNGKRNFALGFIWKYATK